MAKVLSSLLRVWQIHSHNRSEQLLKLEEQMSYGIDFKKCGQFFLQISIIVLFTDFHAESTKEKDQICRNFQQLFFTNFHAASSKENKLFCQNLQYYLFSCRIHLYCINILLIYTISYSRHLRNHCSRNRNNTVCTVYSILQYRKCTIAQVYNERYRTTY